MDNNRTKNICRACLTEKGIFQSVFLAESNSELSLHISEMMNACATIQVIVGDGLPEQICTECAQATVKMYLFKLKCEKSDRILKTRLIKDTLNYNENVKNECQAKTTEPIEPKIEAQSEDNAQIETIIEDFASDCYEKTAENTTDIKEHYENQMKEMECDIYQEKLSTDESLTSHKIVHAIKKDELDVTYEELQANNTFMSQLEIKSENNSFFWPKSEISFEENFERNQNLIGIQSELENNPYGCDICFEGFSQISDLKEHIKTHNNEELVPLSNLSKDYNRKNILADSKEKSEFYDHSQRHSGEVSLICSESFDSSSLTKQKKIHLKKKINKCKNGKKPLECDICKKKFTHSSSLKRHKSTHLATKPFECEICKKKLASRDYLKIHLTIHSGGKQYECDICKNKFTQPTSLNRHKKIHLASKPLECDICKKKFANREYLKIHLRIHSDEKPYECDICKKAFVKLQGLQRHKGIHSGEKPYQCDVCKNKFTRLSYLNSHKRIHTADKAFDCDSCKKKFAKRSYLNTHLLVHSGEKPFECEVCKKKFTDPSNLNSHKRIHTGEKPFECEICKKKFAKREYLIPHLGIHTSEKPFECSVCKKKFTQLSHLYRHKETHG